MNTTAIKQFLDDPNNGWERRKVGTFVRYVWPFAEPPRWSTVKTLALHVGSSRAFLGNIPTGAVQVVDRALEAIESAFAHAGFDVPAEPECPVVLWDMTFPLPVEWELPDVPGSRCPVTILSSQAHPHTSTLILLPTHESGRFGGRDLAWLESSALHEGFHALLGRWLGGAQSMELHRRDRWAKFEEMCAVAMETRLARRVQAWMDYGRSWQSTLSLSHCDNNWAAFLHPQDGNFDHWVNTEVYGHFALIAFLQEHFCPAQSQVGDWLKVVWTGGRELGSSIDPWTALDNALADVGGVAALFQAYVSEATFPSFAGGIIAELHAVFGPPASAVLERHRAAKFFAIGPLAAQLLTCRILSGPPAGIVEVVDFRGLRDTVVQAFALRGPSGKPVPIEPIIEMGEATRPYKSWQFALNRADPISTEIRLIVSQPNHQGRSLAFTATWQ
ncbi:hypothetical protein GALL_310740 [mine drainage metagenome]|uniref:Uncharacterized protein n=1 Tax=mine drainage metagenome TaxID=410659 RepID=A0A1J5R506_9ZZZZ